MSVYHKITILLIVLVLCFQKTTYAQDTLSAAKPVKPSRPAFKAEPQRATMLALTLPGLGQIYNRKYWKIPLVYAGFGGLIYAISYNSSLYTTVMKAYQDFTDANPDTDSYLEIIAADPRTYDPVRFPDTYKQSEAAWYEERMLKQIDYNKKYRDLSSIGIAFWYMITVLDANVDASLFNYDISNNLDIEVTPVQMPLSGAGVGLNVSMIVTF